MDWADYDQWWIHHTDNVGELVPDLPEPVATLAAHVMALQERLDNLPGPEAPDREILECPWTTQCACAYDHPEAVCTGHPRRLRVELTTDEAVVALRDERGES